jgi:hypothetical protein
MTSTLLLLAVLASMPEGADYEAPAAALKGPSSSRLALPVAVRFDESLTDDVSKLVNEQSGAADPAHQTREPVWAVSRYALSVARRHFEQASWGDKKAPRSIVVKSVSCSWRDGPHYECKVVVDRYDGARRLGQATGSGFGYADRTAERQGAAWAGPFSGAAMAEAGKPRPKDDGVVIRHATVAALDQALYQLAAVWAGEQLSAEMMKKAQDAARGKK